MGVGLEVAVEGFKGRAGKRGEDMILFIEEGVTAYAR